MKLAIAGAVLAAAALASSSAAADPGGANLHIQVSSSVGEVEFQTDLQPGSFHLGDGESRDFNNLAPGTYVVVQAPPAGSSLQVSCDNGEFIQVTLADGDDVTCTYTVG